MTKPEDNLSNAATMRIGSEVIVSTEGAVNELFIQHMERLQQAGCSLVAKVIELSDDYARIEYCDGRAWRSTVNRLIMI